MKYIIFEDGLHDNYYPLSLTRPLWELKSGIFSFGDRIIAYLKKHKPDFNENDLYYFTRDNLIPHARHIYGKDCVNNPQSLKDNDLMLFNSTFVPDESIFKMKENCALVRDETPLAACISKESIPLEEKSPVDLILEICDCVNIQYEEPSESTHCFHIWDCVTHNGENIRRDWDILGVNTGKPDSRCVTVSGEESLCYIDESVTIEPFVTFDTTEGPVYIDTGAEIHSFSRIEGPCYIGKGAIILGARLRGGCYIGEKCRIGGEVEESVFHGFSNKYHDGFIGHAYVGEWVNFGAMTANSDLKNNYSNVTVNVHGRHVDTGEMKIGSFIGDFVKTSIGTLIATGAMVGTASILVHNGSITPDHIPPFTWYRDSSISFREWFNKFLHIAETAALRRGIAFSSEYINLLEKLYNETAQYRENL